MMNAMAASVLGAAAAQLSVMGKLVVPEMTQKGYKKDSSTQSHYQEDCLAQSLLPLC